MNKQTERKYGAVRSKPRLVENIFKQTLRKSHRQIDIEKLDRQQRDETEQSRQRQEGK